MNAMIQALQSGRNAAPVSSSGPAPSAPVPPEAPADPLEEVNKKLDTILALLQKDEADDAPNANTGEPDNGPSSD